MQLSFEPVNFIADYRHASQLHLLVDTPTRIQGDPCIGSTLKLPNLSPQLRLCTQLIRNRTPSASSNETRS